MNKTNFESIQNCNVTEIGTTKETCEWDTAKEEQL